MHYAVPYIFREIGMLERLFMGSYTATGPIRIPGRDPRFRRLRTSMTARKSLTRAWFGTVGANALILLGGVGTGILAARLLGPEDRGLLAAVMFWPALLAGIGFLSLNEAIVYRVNNSETGRRSFTATVALLCIMLSAVVIGIGTFLMPILLGPERVQVLKLGTVYLWAFIPVNFIALGLLGIDHADRRFRRYNLLRLLPPWFYLTGILALWAIGAVSLQTLLMATWLGTALTAGIRVWMWRHEVLAWPDLREMCALVRQGALFHSATLISVASAQVDRVVVIRFFPDAEIGLYVVALTLASAGLGLVTNSVRTVLFPTLAVEQDREFAIARLRVGLRRSTLFLFGGSFVAIALIPLVLPILFGGDFQAATPVAILLVIAFAPLALRQIIISCVRAFGDSRTGVVAEAVAFTIFIVVVGPAIEIFDLDGVAIALILANVTALTVASANLQRRYGLDARTWLVPSRAMFADAHDLLRRVLSSTPA